MVFRQHGHWNRFDLTEHFALQWQMALLDISGNIWAQRAPLRHLPCNNNFTILPLPEYLPSYDHPSRPVAFPRYLSNGVRHDHKHVLFCLRAIVGHVVKLFCLGYVDSGCRCIRSDVFCGSIHNVS